MKSLLVAFLALTVVSTSRAEGDDIARASKALDSASHQVREKAMGELKDLGPSAVPALKELAKRPRSPEQKARLEAIIECLDPTVSEEQMAVVLTKELESDPAVVDGNAWAAAVKAAITATERERIRRNRQSYDDVLTAMGKPDVTELRYRSLDVEMKRLRNEYVDLVERSFRNAIGGFAVKDVHRRAPGFPPAQFTLVDKHGYEARLTLRSDGEVTIVPPRQNVTVDAAAAFCGNLRGHREDGDSLLKNLQTPFEATFVLTGNLFDGPPLAPRFEYRWHAGTDRVPTFYGTAGEAIRNYLMRSGQVAF